MGRPCMAITLVNPQRPQEAGSYLWCKEVVHSIWAGHNCYSGVVWTSSDLVEPTENMRLWRTGSAEDVRLVSGKLLG